MVNSILLHKLPEESGSLKRFLTWIILLLASAQVNGQSTGFFDQEDLLLITLRTDMKSLMKDRDVESDYHKAEISYTDKGKSITIPLEVKTRGNFRKKSSNCKYPPLRLNFKKSETPESSIFAGMDKVKLVTPCRDEELVVREYLVYKIYNLITPRSFKVRLIKLVYEDQADNNKSDPYYSVIIEEEKAMAKRNRAKPVEKIGLNPQAIQKDNFLEMAVFQFLVANTDWSVQYLQNTKLMLVEGERLPTIVPYDFDHAGIVRAPYAKPAPELQLPTTLHRRYRGYCPKDMSDFDEIFEKFNKLKPEFRALYEENNSLSDSYKKKTLKFLDKFYETINNQDKVERAFTYPCDPYGTGRVVIKGLKPIKE